MKKILVIRFSSIGDIVLTSPVFRCLKQQLPDCEVHFLTKQEFKGIVEFNPYIDRLHLYKGDLGEVLDDLRSEGFHRIIDLHKNIRSFLVKRRLGTKSNSLEKLNLKKWLLVNFKSDFMPDVHIVERYLETLSGLGVKNDGKGLDYFFPPDMPVPLKELPEEFRPGYIGWVIGAKHVTKQLPPLKAASVISQLNKPVVLLGGPAEKVSGEMILQNTTGKVFNAAGKFSLHESAALVKQAQKIKTHDTGLMHIAAAFKKPILSIWGNTVPAFGMYPYFPAGSSAEKESVISEVSRLPCRPCSKLGFTKCPKEHFQCMELQDEKRIADWAND